MQHGRCCKPQTASYLPEVRASQQGVQCTARIGAWTSKQSCAAASNCPLCWLGLPSPVGCLELYMPSNAVQQVNSKPHFCLPTSTIALQVSEGAVGRTCPARTHLFCVLAFYAHVLVLTAGSSLAVSAQGLGGEDQCTGIMLLVLHRIKVREVGMLQRTPAATCPASGRRCV